MNEQTDGKFAKILQLTTETITLSQAIKKAGIGTTGGHSKFIVKDGLIQVNGQVVKTPGLTLRAGDHFGLVKGELWVVQQQ